MQPIRIYWNVFCPTDSAGEYKNSKLANKSLLLCIIQQTLRSNCLVLENSPLRLDENLSPGKFFSLLFFALRIIINLQSELLSFLNLVEIVCKDFTHGGYQKYQIVF